MTNTNWIIDHDIGYDYVKPNGFRMLFNSMPHVSYFCQSANIPGFDGGSATFPTPFQDIPISGDKGIFEPLKITFIIDAKLLNFIELRNWLVGMNFPDSNQQFIDYKTANTNNSLLTHPRTINGIIAADETGLYTDATLTILTAKNNAFALLLFHDIFPRSLSSVELETTVTGIEYLVASATFSYQTYTVELLA